MSKSWRATSRFKSLIISRNVHPSPLKTSYTANFETLDGTFGGRDKNVDVRKTACVIEETIPEPTTMAEEGLKVGTTSRCRDPGLTAPGISSSTGSQPGQPVGVDTGKEHVWRRCQREYSCSIHNAQDSQLLGSMAKEEANSRTEKGGKTGKTRSRKLEERKRHLRRKKCRSCEKTKARAERR